MAKVDIRKSKQFTALPLDAGLFNSEAERSTTLPSDWYYDPEIYRREHEAIFYRTWQRQAKAQQAEKDRQAKKAKQRKNEGAANRFKPGGANRSKRSRGGVR